MLSADSDDDNVDDVYYSPCLCIYARDDEYGIKSPTNNTITF